MRELLLGSALSAAGAQSAEGSDSAAPRDNQGSGAGAVANSAQAPAAPTAPAPRVASLRLCMESPGTAHPGGSGGASIAPSWSQGCRSPDPTHAPRAGPQKNFIPPKAPRCGLGPGPG